MDQKEKSFTLSELLVVLVIIGIVASFVMPNFNKAVSQAQERDAISKLLSIRTAAEVYKAQTGSYPTTPLSDINAINTTLGINLTQGIFNVFCDLDDGFECNIEHPDGWVIHFHEGPGPTSTFALHCAGMGTIDCPTCPQSTACGGQD